MIRAAENAASPPPADGWTRPLMDSGLFVSTVKHTWFRRTNGGKLWNGKYLLSNDHTSGQLGDCWLNRPTVVYVLCLHNVNVTLLSLFKRWFLIRGPSFLHSVHAAAVPLSGVTQYCWGGRPLETPKRTTLQICYFKHFRAAVKLQMRPIWRSHLFLISSLPLNSHAVMSFLFPLLICVSTSC